jgi:excisionase family DNA binding protein
MTFDELRESNRAVISMSEAASILGVDRRLVAKAVANGTIKAIHLGGRKRVIPRAPFIELIEGDTIGDQDEVA